MWTMAPGWRNRLKLVLVLFKALWQQERFIFAEDGESSRVGETRS
jgi:hypothetical protein